MSCDPVGGDPGVLSGGADETAREQVNSWLAAINPVTSHLIAERTSYSSQLIPVTPYVTVSVVPATPAGTRVCRPGVPTERPGTR